MSHISTPALKGMTKCDSQTWCIAINNWIKFPTFYKSMDQISQRHAKKLGPAPLNVIIGGATGDT